MDKFKNKKKEINKLKKIFKVIYEDEENKHKKSLVDDLINRAGFMIVILNECEQEILDKGIIVEMQQGQYTIERENPALKSYVAIIKSYQSVISQLLSLVPKEVEKNKLSEDAQALIGGK